MDVASRKNIPIFILIFNSHYSDLLNEVHNGICQKPQRLCLLVGYFSARCNKKNHNFQMPSVARGISKSHFDWNFFKVLKIRLLFKVPNCSGPQVCEIGDWKISRRPSVKISQSPHEARSAEWGDWAIFTRGLREIFQSPISQTWGPPLLQGTTKSLSNK